MKKYIMTIFILTTGLTISQNNPTDKISTAQTKIIKVNDGDITYNKKVKVITSKEQEIKLDPKDRGLVNKDRIFPPVKVTKTILIDKDKDAFYDELTTVKYYEMDRNNYAFEKREDDFVENYFKKNRTLISEATIKSNTNAYYFIKNNEKHSLGYFDNNDKFMIEYFSIEEDKIEKSEFESLIF